MSEALANAIKHAQASLITIEVESTDAVLRASGARTTGSEARLSGEGTGLSGLVDRIDALGGTLAIASPPSGGTRVEIELPTG